MEILIGLDIGTTNIKALAFDVQGSLIAAVKEPTAIIDSATQEISPDELWRTCARLIHQVVKSTADGDLISGRSRILGISIASFGESGLLIDRHGHPITSIISWYDQRTLKWVNWWRERITEERLYSITGLPYNHIYSVNKLLWLREQQPDLFTSPVTWLCVADWITFCLTGQRATNPSLASRTMMYDLSEMCWSEEILSVAQLKSSLLPPVSFSGTILGQVNSHAASLTGLIEGTPVIVGGHDHACAAIAAGAIEPGTILSSSGTVEAIFTPTDHPIPAAQLASSGICCGCHTVPGKYYLIGGVMTGIIVEWMSRVFSGSDELQNIERLMRTGASTEKGSNGIVFIPDLAGSGPPQLDPNAWGAWLGLRLEISQADMVRSTMEGLSYRCRQLLEGIILVSGQPMTTLRSVGGGTYNTWWQQIKADVFGTPLEISDLSEATAQGAALLAGIGVGVYGNAEKAFQSTKQVFTRYEVNPENHIFYNRIYKEIFLPIDPILKRIRLTIS